MARLLQEFFEATGYDDAAGWTESVGAGATVDEDQATSAVGSPSGWGSQCLRIVAPGSQDANTMNSGKGSAISFVRFEVIVTAASFAADGENTFLSILFSAAFAVQAVVLIDRDAGASRFVIVLDTNLDTVIDTAPYVQPLVLGKMYTVEIKWDTTNDLWEVWVDGISAGSGALTGAATTAPFDVLSLGTFSTTLGTYTAHFDRIEVDDANHIGPDTEQNSTFKIRTIQSNLRMR